MRSLTFLIADFEPNVNVHTLLLLLGCCKIFSAALLRAWTAFDTRTDGASLCIFPVTLPVHYLVLMFGRLSFASYCDRVLSSQE